MGSVRGVDSLLTFSKISESEVDVERLLDAIMKFSRITVEQDKMNGVPCIRGLRIPVATVVGMFASGMSMEEILTDYPDLDKEDILEALAYAAEAVNERQVPLVEML